MTLKSPAVTRRLFGASSLALSVGALTAAGALAKAKEKLPYKDASLTTEARVADLLGRMTLEEKVAQMLCVWQKKGDIQDPDGKFNPKKASQVYPNGLGMVARPSDQQGLATTTGAGDSGAMGNRDAFNTATHINAMQKWATEQTRLGIPMIMHEEALHGYVAKDATSFPQAIGLASSFDPDGPENILRGRP
jgi:beta-glucosidase